MQLYIKSKKFHYQLAILSKLLKVATVCLLFTSSFSLFSCEGSNTKYQITQGDPQAKLNVTQHFSLGSPEFVRFLKEEFPLFKSDYIDTGLVQWTFCPCLVDVTTLQFNACLGLLSESQRSQFCNQVFLELSPRTFESIPEVFLKALGELSTPPESLETLKELKMSDLFKSAGEFLDRAAFRKSQRNFQIGECAFDFLPHAKAIRYHIEKEL